jgi:DNA modification methylase
MDHSVHLGSATDPSFYPSSAHLILADPPFPYASRMKQYTQIRKENKTTLAPIPTPPPEDYLAFWEACLTIWQHILDPSGWLIFKSDDYGSKVVFQLTSQYFTYLGDIIWDKVAIGVGRYIRKCHEVLCVYRPLTPQKSYFLYNRKKKTTPIKHWHGGSQGIALSSVFHFLRIQAGIKGQKEQGHINQTPMEVWRNPLKYFCPSNGIVVDPFCGSGSILKEVQYQINHKHPLTYWGIDVMPQYVQQTQALLTGGLTAFIKKGEKINHESM